MGTQDGNPDRIEPTKPPPLILLNLFENVPAIISVIAEKREAL